LLTTSSRMGTGKLCSLFCLLYDGLKVYWLLQGNVKNGVTNTLMSRFSLRLRCLRGQSIKKPNFFSNLLLYLQLKLLTFKALPSIVDTPLPTFSISGTRFAGRREGPVSNFLLSPLPSEIGDLLVGISTSGTRKIPQGSNLESRAARGQQSSHASSKVHR